MNTITFGGVLSSTYDIYISGEGVWSAPERDAEVITIPGRNGAFVQDNGRFQNITVTYPAFIVKDNNTNFKTKIDGFRNAMASKVGYQRLVDTYHADEYRMAAFIGGMEVEPILYNDHAATFDLVFECKPQRFLTSGETAVSVANNGTITNPTLFDSSPLLEVKGYGTIGINGETISIENTEIGQVMLANKTSDFVTSSFISLDAGNYQLLDTGDTITLTEGSYFTRGIGANNYTTNKVTALTTTVSGNISCSVASIPDTSYVGRSKKSKITITEPIVFTKGTASTQSLTVNESATYKVGSTTSSYSGSYVISFEYQPSQSRIFVTTSNHSPSLSSQLTAVSIRGESVISEIYGYSTRVTLTNSFYIDLDIGEAYSISNNDVANLNNIVQLPAKLPTLAPGTNTFTKDNTITQLKVTPRWWKI